MFRRLAVLISLAPSLLAAHDQAPLQDPTSEPWLAKYGAQIDQPFSGPLSFAHLPYARCLEQPGRALDVALLGLPFDTAVTYRPGARFGPHAIRAGARRQRAIRGWTLGWGLNPYAVGTDVIDCGT
jgi:agmatinase